MNSKTIALLFGVLLALGAGVGAQVNAPKTKDLKATASRDKSEPLKTGEIAPDFTLNDSAGRQVTLSKAGMPVILVFYRGYW
jgi:cytochrome oxidase Cu insertion factor (SCO1/SenC/PrrC family)